MVLTMTAENGHHSVFKRAAHDTVDDGVLCALRVTEQQCHGQRVQRDRVVVTDEVQVETDSVIRQPRDGEQPGDDPQHPSYSTSSRHDAVFRRLPHSATGSRQNQGFIHANTIRYDRIEEFNVDSKAECTA